MSIEIQKQLNLQAFKGNNSVTKPEVGNPSTELAADEEKSNAAKWMIGLTATAAIVLGGLYAAKHGKLGESAEKFAKKLFGEGVNEIKNKTSQAAPTTENATPALAFITPALIRAKIKNPKIKLNDFIQELEKANLSFRKFEVTVPKPATHIKPASGEGVEPWSFRFDKDGVLTSIRKKVSDVKDIVYRFEDNILSSVEHRFSVPNGKPVQHVVEFDRGGEIERQLYKFELQGGQKIEFEPPQLTRSLPAKEKVKRTKNELIDKISQHVSKEEAAAYAKLLDDQLGSVEKLKPEELIQNILEYNSKLKAHRINKPEHITIAAKKVSECSYDEFVEILKEIAPEKAGRLGVIQDQWGSKAQEQEVVMHQLERLSGRSSINSNTTILDLLADLSK